MTLGKQNYSWRGSYDGQRAKLPFQGKQLLELSSGAEVMFEFSHGPTADDLDELSDFLMIFCKQLRRAEDREAFVARSDMSGVERNND